MPRPTLTQIRSRRIAAILLPGRSIVNSRHRSHVSRKRFLLVALGCAVAFAIPSTAAAAKEAPSGVIYTASDFPRLGEGIDPGLSGEVFVSVWAPAQQTWHLSLNEQTLTLRNEAARCLTRRPAGNRWARSTWRKTKRSKSWCRTPQPKKMAQRLWPRIPRRIPVEA